MPTHDTCYIPKILSGIHLEYFEKPSDFVGDPLYFNDDMSQGHSE